MLELTGDDIAQLNDEIPTTDVIDLSVHWAGNLQSGAQKFDVLLSDLHMPGPVTASLL
jgi:hypothetical protein